MGDFYLFINSPCLIFFFILTSGSDGPSVRRGDDGHWLFPRKWRCFYRLRQGTAGGLLGTFATEECWRGDIAAPVLSGHPVAPMRKWAHFSRSGIRLPGDGGCQEARV